MGNIEIHHIVLGLSDSDSELGLFSSFQATNQSINAWHSLDPYRLNGELLLYYISGLKAVAL